jgi:hypothetical protein
VGWVVSVWITTTVVALPGGKIHTCRYPANTAASAAFSTSASSNTINGAFPPSSSITGFRCSPAFAAILRPTAVLPVKLILRTSRCAISAFVISGPSSRVLPMTFRAPGGSPASTNMDARR